MDQIRIGAAGPQVLDVQRRLEGLGMSCAPDDPGVFGPGTEKAVRVFQQQRGLAADGSVGEETWSVLVEAGYRLGDRLLYQTRPMLRGDDVLDLQRRLNRLGFDTEYLDGVFGPQTAEALREFQLNAGVVADGIAGEATLAALTRLQRQHQTAAAAAVRERERMRTRHPSSLAGLRVLVDPAHGAAVPGLRHDNGTEEHQITWAIATRLSGRLGGLGFHPVLARGPANSPTSSERAALANREEVEAIVSIHLNGLAQSDARGVAAYYFGSEGFVSERGRVLAQLCVDRIVEATGTLDCRTHPSTMTILRESRAPAVVVEAGFLTHPREGVLLQDPGYQGLLAGALADALVAFLSGAVAA